MKIFFKATGILIVTSICFLFLGCSNTAAGLQTSENNNPDMTASVQNNAKAIYYLSSKPTEYPVIQVIKKIADEYRAEVNPNFYLNIESISDRSTYLQKLKTLIASNETPDWFDVDPDPYFEKLVEQDLLVNIGDLYDGLGVTDQFYPISLEYPRLSDGSLYLITFECNMEMFWYNKELFEEANITPPETFEEFIQVCEALSGHHITPIAFNGKDKWALLRYLSFIPFRISGNSYIERLKAGNASMGDEEGLRAAAFVRELGSKYFQPDYINTDYTAARNLFLQGDAAMYYMGSWELPSFEENTLPDHIKGNLDYFTLPTTDNAATAQSDFWINSGIGMAISKQSFDPVTVDFLSYFFKKYPQTAINFGKYLPSMKIDENVASPLLKRILNDINNVKTFGYCWDVQFDPETNELIGDELVSLSMGIESVEEFAEKIDKSIRENAQAFFD